MKILYIVPAISESSKGILKKQYDKLNAFEKAGCYVKAFFFSESLKDERQEKNIMHIPIKHDEIKSKYSKFIIWRLLPYFLSKNSNKIIYNAVVPQIANVDIVYIRFSGTDFNAIPLYKAIRKAGKQIAFEYNGNHFYDEIVNIRNTPSVFTYYRYFNEKFFQKRVARYSNILIGVTRELTDYYFALNPFALTFTLSNGVNVARFPVRIPPAYDGEHLRFLFLSGSVNYWHGIDRFLKGLQRYVGERTITLTIAGPISSEFKSYKYRSEKVKVNFVDTVIDQTLDLLIDSHHIGIGSLGLHRMKLKEASVLKVREYIARGIPFILSYHDTDLLGSEEMKPFYLKVSPDESALDIEKIIEFADRVLKMHNYSFEMRAIGAPLIDYLPKINRLAEVFKKSLTAA
jgi:hypothetical protein